MRQNPFLSPMIDGPCLEFTFQDSEAFFNLPASLVRFDDFGDILFKIGANRIKPIIGFLLLDQVRIKAQGRFVRNFARFRAVYLPNQSPTIVAIERDTPGIIAIH